MGLKLDRNKPFGNIFGIDDHGAVFTQGNDKFDVNGNECGAGITPVVEDPVRPGAAGPAPTEPVTVDVVADLEATLKPMHPSQIKKLVEEAGLTPATGTGSKAANIAQLIAADSG